MGDATSESNLTSIGQKERNSEVHALTEKKKENLISKMKDEIKCKIEQIEEDRNRKITAFGKNERNC